MGPLKMQGLLSSYDGKESLQCRRPWFDPWVRKIPLEKEMATHSSIRARRNPMNRGVWWATVHGVAKELDTI